MNKTKVIVSIVSIVLVLAVATGLVGYFTNGFKDWFGSDKAPVEEIPTPDPVPEVKEKSVAFDLKLVYNEDMAAYSSALTPEQNRALLEYPNATFFADFTVDGEEGKVTKHIPLIYFSMCEFDPASPFVTYAFSDTGAQECNVAFVVNGVVGLEEPEIFVMSMVEASIKFDLTYAEDSASVAKPAIDYANSLIVDLPDNGDESVGTLTFILDESTIPEYNQNDEQWYVLLPMDTVLPGYHDCPGTVILHESMTSSGETLPAREYDVVWEYEDCYAGPYTGKGSDGLSYNMENCDIYQWTAYFNKSSNSKYGYIRVWVSLSTGEIIAKRVYTYAGCSTFIINS